MPARVRLHINDGETKVDMTGVVTRDRAVAMLRNLLEGSKEWIAKTAKETLDSGAYNEVGK